MERNGYYLLGVSWNDQEAFESIQLEVMQRGVDGEVDQFQMLETFDSVQRRQIVEDRGAGGTVFQSQVTQVAEPREHLVVALFRPLDAVANLQVLQLRQIDQMLHFVRLQVAQRCQTL